jgi:hypothetical protein
MRRQARRWSWLHAIKVRVGKGEVRHRGGVGGEAVLFWAYHGQSAWLKVVSGADAASGEAEDLVFDTEPVHNRQY